MKYIPVNNTDLSVSEIALGCMRIASKSESQVSEESPAECRLLQSVKKPFLRMLQRTLSAPLYFLYLLSFSEIHSCKDLQSFC